MRPEYHTRPGVAREIGIALRVAARALVRRLRGEATGGDGAGLRADLERWARGLPPGTVAATKLVDLPATQPPWVDTGLDLEAGQRFTAFGHGRVYLARLLDIYTPPWFQLWFRLGGDGTIFRGTRDLWTFTASTAGRLQVGNYFPGEWSDRQGGLATPAADYARVSGGNSLLLVAWRDGVDVEATLRASLAPGHCPAALAREIERLAEPVVAPPERWEYLWFLGPAEVYRPSLTHSGRRSIDCRTHGDTGILQREARIPLAPGTRLAWSWRVDELPTDLPEDTLPSHEYLSIAVEFDDGQDITYFWSSSLPVGTGFGCPLPNWKDRETHVVVRSGRADLGRWLDEERDVCADYAEYVGGPAREIVRVWLIANSLLTRGRGRCEYAGISLLTGDGEKIEVL